MDPSPIFSRSFSPTSQYRRMGKAGGSGARARTKHERAASREVGKEWRQVMVACKQGATAREASKLTVTRRQGAAAVTKYAEHAFG
jgi:hypothetical protein